MLEKGVSSESRFCQSNFSYKVPRIALKALDLSKLNDLENTAIEGNSLDLRPDPIHLVKLISDIKRKDVTSRFFMRILMANMESQTLHQKQRLLQGRDEADPTR